MKSDEHQPSRERVMIRSILIAISTTIFVADPVARAAENGAQKSRNQKHMKNACWPLLKEITNGLSTEWMLISAVLSLIFLENIRTAAVHLCETVFVERNMIFGWHLGVSL